MSGYACFSTNYRLAPDVRFPAMVEDIASVAQFIVEHGENRFRCDPQKLAVMGSSAGGHLAALVGLVPEKFGYQQTENVRRPFCAVSCVAAPMDFRIGQSYAQKPDDPIAATLFGKPLKEAPELAEFASPISHIHAGAPPFSFQHYKDDPQVDAKFSMRMHEALQTAGVHSELNLYDGDTHRVYDPLRPFMVTHVAVFTQSSQEL